MAEHEPGVLARRLDHLFTNVHPKGRGPYSLREAAQAINDRAGEKLISAAYLSALRTGQKREPSSRRLSAIAEFFGVQVGYFSDDDVAARTNEQLEALAAMRDGDVRTLALRAAELSPRALKAILQIVESTRAAEGLPTENLEKPGPD